MKIWNKFKELEVKINKNTESIAANKKEQAEYQQRSNNYGAALTPTVVNNSNILQIICDELKRKGELPPGLIETKDLENEEKKEELEKIEEVLSDEEKKKIMKKATKKKTSKRKKKTTSK